MKRVCFILILFLIGSVYAQIAPSEVGEQVNNIGKNVNFYAEFLGQFLLKFQNFFMGIVGFFSLGFFNVGEDMAFAIFLFALLLFMLIYNVIGFFFKRFNFGIAFIITVLAIMGINEETLISVFMNYGAMGIIMTVILPILILLSFTFRIYQKAYEGESRTSPFYAEMFNLVFLIFFGVFFIRHSASEEGVISIMRFVSGIGLIVLGIAQTLFYKIFADMFHMWKLDSERFKREMRMVKEEAVDKLRDTELGLNQES